MHAGSFRCSDDLSNHRAETTMKLPREASARRRSGRMAVATRADWFREPPESDGLARSLGALREKWWLIALCVGLAVGPTIVVASNIQKVYQANATMLVQPVPASDETLLGLGLPSASADPSRDVETISQLIRTPAVAERVRGDLGLEASARSLLKKIRAEPVAQSSIVNVAAKANSPGLAAQLANAFGQAAVAERTDRLHQQIDLVIPQLRDQIAQVPAGNDTTIQALTAKLQSLQTLRALPDPTLHLVSQAEPPTSPVSPSLKLRVAVAGLGGLILGIVMVLASQLFDTRLQTVDELRRYPLPILARIPIEHRRPFSGQRRPLRPDLISNRAMDSYNLLAASISDSWDEARGSSSVAITGPTPSDGKTTVALNLAASLSGAARGAVLIEGDARRPALGAATGLAPVHDVSSVIAGRVGLTDALVYSDYVDPPIRMVLQDTTRLPAAPLLTGEIVAKLVTQAELIADWVIFDAPPPTHVSDGLTVAKHSDIVLVVVRLGNTRVRDLEQLAELFAQQDITPLGFVVIGGRDQSAYYGPS
jgi:capsular polysaccharide biosynthesis protein